MVIRHNPNTLDLPVLLLRPGAMSGKEIPMDRHRQPVIADESHESAKKPLTRRRPHTLRSDQPSENAGTLGAFILTNGATDASSR
jgi:hypothetical protein